MLTTRRMELGSPLLVEFDLGALVGAQEGPAKQAAFLEALSKAGKARAIRRLSVVARATEDQLRQAEADTKVMAALEEEAAMRPFSESYKDAVDFFGQWGRSFVIAPVSSAPESSPKAPENPEGSPFVASSPL